MVSKRQVNAFDNRAVAHPIMLANSITFSYYFMENILSGNPEVIEILRISFSNPYMAKPVISN